MLWIYEGKKIITRVDSSEIAFLVVLEPGNVVTLAGNVVVFQGRLEHSQIGLAARRREPCTDVAPLFFRLSWMQCYKTFYGRNLRMFVIIKFGYYFLN
jgi:hypothetical protein